MQRFIRPHHQEGINNLIAEYHEDPRFAALIIGGSVAKGCAREDSDVDFMMVATNEEFAKRSKTGDLFINRRDLTNYTNGFVDGKIISLDYLLKVKEKGNEPTRAAFDGAFIGFSKVNELERLIEEINIYPENLRNDKLFAFYSMSFIQNWLMGEAERHNNLYTRNRAATQLVLFAGRLILAYNRIFFPYHKWFYEYVQRCPEQPLGLIKQMNTVLENPNSSNANKLFKSIAEFQNWNISDLEAYHWFMEKVEMSWMSDSFNFEDW